MILEASLRVLFPSHKLSLNISSCQSKCLEIIRASSDGNEDSITERIMKWIISNNSNGAGLHDKIPQKYLGGGKDDFSNAFIGHNECQTMNVALA